MSFRFYILAGCGCLRAGPGKLLYNTARHGVMGSQLGIEALPQLVLALVGCGGRRQTASGKR